MTASSPVPIASDLPTNRPPAAQATATSASEPTAVPVAAPSPKLWHVGTLTYTAGGLVALFALLLWGDFAWNMKERAITPVAQVMLRNFQASDLLVGLLVGSIPAAIGMILGPVVSVWSDRHRGPWGRRIPFLLVPTPVIMLAMFGLAITPELGFLLHHYLSNSSPGLMTSRIIVFAFFWASFEIATISVNFLFGALINDVVPQKLIGRFYGMFRAVSLIAAIIFNFKLMGMATTHFFEILVALALLYGIGFAWMCLRVKEGHYPPPPPRDPSLAQSRFVQPVLTYLRECFTRPFYLCFFIATTLGGLALGPVNTFSIFHARSVGMDDDLYGKCLAMSYVISLALAYPLGILADRFHPVRLGIFGMAVYVVVMIYGYLFATGTWTFFAAFVLHTVVAGTYLTSTASIAQRLLPRAKYASFASAAGIVGAVCYMILPPALGLFIQSMNHQYAYVFLLGSLIALASAASYVLLYLQFLRHGGDRAYVAPE